MTKKNSLGAVVLLCSLSMGVCFAEQVAWNDGGPEYLYPKVGEKPAAS